MHFVFQYVAGLEGEHEFGRDELALAGGGIDDDAFHLLLHFEHSEALHGQRGVGIEKVGHGCRKLCGEFLHGFLREAAGTRQGVGEVFVVHGILILFEVMRF